MEVPHPPLLRTHPGCQRHHVSRTLTLESMVRHVILTWRRDTECCFGGQFCASRNVELAKMLMGSSGNPSVFPAREEFPKVATCIDFLKYIKGRLGSVLLDSEAA